MRAKETKHLFAAFAVAFSLFAADCSGMETLSLDGLCDFSFCEGGALAEATAEFKADGKMPVPGCFDLMPPWRMKRGVGSYRRTFSVGRDAPSSALKVGSYNVRCSPADAGTPNAWPERKDDLLALLRRLDLDAGGLQEVCPDQLKFFRDGMPEYEFVGDGRKADRKSGEASPVFWRKERFDGLKSGTFWLSETPDVPGSKGWDAGWPRVCTYAILRDRRTHGLVCFLNAHIDGAPQAGEMGMRLILERIGKIVTRMEGAQRRISVVFTGDHNCRETQTPALLASETLTDAVLASETPPLGPWRSYNGWAWSANAKRAAEAVKHPREKRNRFGYRIDYIYVSRDVRVLDCETVEEARPGKQLYPSDHFLVVATLEATPSQNFKETKEWN